MCHGRFERCKVCKEVIFVDPHEEDAHKLECPTKNTCQMCDKTKLKDDVSFYHGFLVCGDCKIERSDFIGFKLYDEQNVGIEDEL